MEFFEQVMHDESQDMETRLAAAIAGAPYVHKKQPVAVEIENEGMPSIVMIVSPLTETHEIIESGDSTQMRTISASLEPDGGPAGDGNG